MEQRAAALSTATALRREWPGLCTLVRPRIAVRQVALGFCFFDASVLLIEQGSLVFSGQDEKPAMSSADGLICVDQDYRSDLIKTPELRTGLFQSLFLSIDASLIAEFLRTQGLATVSRAPAVSALPLDEVLADTWRFTLRALDDAQTVTESEVRSRLLGLLVALSVRGTVFRVPSQSLAVRIRTLLSGNPAYPWTVAEVGRHVAMSEATLRRHLAREGSLFQGILQDVRLHNALMLLQTTALSIGQIAAASGYQSASRFSIRFRLRFGHLPSAMR
ncbi:MAG: AraC family transcriptional regulator [Pseudomonas sp.]|nr:AraC family transcriptional regulator [Pseudomonas sp.]